MPYPPNPPHPPHLHLHHLHHLHRFTETLGRNMASASTAVKPRGGAPTDIQPWTMAALALSFLAVHVFTLILSHTGEIGSAADVLLYENWMNMAFDSGQWPVRDFDWVYPVVGLVPMVLTELLHRATGASFLDMWWLVVTAVNVAVAAVMIRTFGWRRSMVPMAVWSVFIVFLGSTAMMRLDPFVPALVMLALIFATRHTTLAAALLTVGAWIKVAPGLVMMPLLAARPKRWRSVLLGGAAVCAGVVTVAVLCGVSLKSLLSFFGTQSGRGLQVEAVLATPAVLTRALSGQSIATYDDTLYTYQIVGGDYGMARVADFLLPVLLAVIAWLTWRARSNPQTALLVGSLAALSAGLVANRVGSPQFMSWMLAPVLIGLAKYGHQQFWRTMAALLSVCALLTHLIFPIAYAQFLDGEPEMILVGLIRNLLVIAILGAALTKLARTPTRHPSRPHPTKDTSSNPAREASTTPQNPPPPKPLPPTPTP